MSFVELTEHHTPRSSDLFLDTSIHCSKLKGSLFKDRIQTVFQLFAWKGTSTYTKVEFGNVVLSNAEYYLRLLAKYGSLEKTLDHIANVLPTKLHAPKVDWAFNLIMRFAGGDDVQGTTRARLSLIRLMKLGTAFVDGHCDGPLANGTKCYWPDKGVQKDGHGNLVWKTPKCKTNQKRCNVDDFFNANRDAFIRIKDAIDNLSADQRSKQLTDFSEVIAKALVDPIILLDYGTGCRKLADAIIAVDSRSYQNLFSQNKNESELLTAALGQDFYYLPPSPDKGLLVQITTLSPATTTADHLNPAKPAPQ